MNKTVPDKAQQRGENWLCSIRITNPYLTPLILKNNIVLHAVWTNSEKWDSPAFAYMPSHFNAYLSILLSPPALVPDWAPRDERDISPSEECQTAPALKSHLNTPLPGQLRVTGRTELPRKYNSDSVWRSDFLLLPSLHSICLPRFLAAGCWEAPEKEPVNMCRVTVRSKPKISGLQGRWVHATAKWHIPGASDARCTLRPAARAQQLQKHPRHIRSSFSILQLLAGIHQPLDTFSSQLLLNSTTSSRCCLPRSAM